ncbi:MAG TPA: DUF378 domain-containing protein [Candidatus Saccharimonadales bacterium]|nr:DUF378 domain-containing protein [Candidatus Saccharimonadales bacterium]
MKFHIVRKAAYFLLVIGGLNLGIIGFFDYDVIGKVFSVEVARIIDGAIGLAALYGCYELRNLTKSGK